MVSGTCGAEGLRDSVVRAAYNSTTFEPWHVTPCHCC